MIALIVATLAEAEPFLNRLQAEERLTHPFPTYSFAATRNRPGGIIVVCGMGPAAASKATDYAIRTRGAKTIINAGICGAVSNTLNPGQLCRVTSTRNGDALLQHRDEAPLPQPAHRAWAHLTPVRLATVTQPVFGGAARTVLAAGADGVDMEGHAVAQVCAQRAIPCCLLKGVSDFADDAGRGELHRNLAEVSGALATAVAEGLEPFTPARPGLMARMLNFVKVEHTLFSLPLLFAGAWIGAQYQWPGLTPLSLVALAGLGARTLGMAMNRLLDRHLDLLNPRTTGRDLPAGTLTPVQGWIVGAAGLLVYLAACVALGPVCLRLAPIPAVVLIGYSLLKRFTHLCHFGIGLSLALGPLGAFVAVTGHTTAPPALLLLTLFTFCWISASDILYALQDIEPDREIGVHSIPVSFGPAGARVIAALVHLTALMAAYGVWRLTGTGLAGGLALAVTGIALALMYCERMSLAFRFFPVSAVAGVAGALIPLLAR